MDGFWIRNGDGHAAVKLTEKGQEHLDNVGDAILGRTIDPLWSEPSGVVVFTLIDFGLVFGPVLGDAEKFFESGLIQFRPISYTSVDTANAA